MGALGSPLCTISPSETPNLRRNQRLVLRRGLTPSMHVHIPQREHADLSSLCPNQLSLCYGLIEGQNNYLRDRSYPQSERSQVTVPTSAEVWGGSCCGQLGFANFRSIFAQWKVFCLHQTRTTEAAAPSFTTFPNFCLLWPVQRPAHVLKMLYAAGAKLFPASHHWQSPPSPARPCCVRPCSSSPLSQPLKERTWCLPKRFLW